MQASKPKKKKGMFLRLLPGHEAKLRAMAAKSGKTLSRIVEEALDREAA